MDIREIARIAGVSPSTVSRALNCVRSVDPGLSQRVWRIAKDSGYYPNRQAQGLATGHSRIFGLIVSEITNPFFPEIVQTFENLAVENNYEVLLMSVMHNSNQLSASVRRMIERRVEGVAVLSFGKEDALLELLSSAGVPLVFADMGPSAPGCMNICIDYLTGIRQAVEHLYDLGHARIAFISGPTHIRSAMSRKIAFQRSMKKIGLSCDLVAEGDHTVEGGAMALSSLDKMGTLPTAVLCSNDMTALGVMREAYERGIKIPDELSVVGFDDIRLAEFTTPPLTTIRMSQTALAKIAFEALLVEVSRGASSRSRAEYGLTTKLIVRGSTSLAGNARQLPRSPRDSAGPAAAAAR